MARRFNSRYQIRLAGGEVFKVSFKDWARAVEDRWIEPEQPGGRLANLCAGVIGRVRNGVLWLRDKFREAYMRTSWAVIEAKAPARGEGYQEELELDYHPKGKATRERYGLVYTGFLGMSADRLRELIDERKAARCATT
jgi:hypothetical protein